MSLKELRAGHGTGLWSWGQPYLSKLSRGKERTQPPSILSFFSFFAPTRTAKEDLLPSANLVGVAFDPEKQEERMDE